VRITFIRRGSYEHCKWKVFINLHAESGFKWKRFVSVIDFCKHSILQIQISIRAFAYRIALGKLLINDLAISNAHFSRLKIILYKINRYTQVYAGVHLS